MDLATTQHEEFFISQKVTLMINRYRIESVDAGGSPGELVAFVEQARFKLKEKITFFAEESKKTELFVLQARQVLDLHARHDVTTPDGSVLGQLGKKFRASLLRSTWQLVQPGVVTATGQERSVLVALLRRVWGLLPWVGNYPAPLVYHFDFVADGTSNPVMSVEKKWGLRDKYRVHISGPVDRRLALAQAVALDAQQSR